MHFVGFTFYKDGSGFIFETAVDLNGLDPESVRVELYAESVNGFERMSTPMRLDKKQKGTAQPYLYTVTLPAHRPPTDYTPRIVPCNINASVPLEASYILWQK